jgi:hypothetical protein
LPPELGDIAKAKIVISNFHAFKRREKMDLSKVGRALLQGRGEAPQTIETEGQTLQRACGELIALKNVVVLNDEAHHCYREKVQTDEESELKPLSLPNELQTALHALYGHYEKTFGFVAQRRLHQR